MKNIEAKFGKMRKPQEFTVYPYTVGDRSITIQSDKSIGQFNPETGKGLLNYKGSGAKYFLHLSLSMGAENFDFPLDFVEQCKNVAPKRNDVLNGIVVID